MLSGEWITFFAVDIGAATALAGLMFVAFSIQQSAQGIDELEKRLGALYFAELLASLVIALAAVLPPHVWWVGALIGATHQIGTWGIAMRKVLAYRQAYRRSRAGDIAKQTDDPKVHMYTLHRPQLATIGVPLMEALVVFVGGLGGALEAIGILPNAIPGSASLEVVGVFSAWYLVSATFGAWYFLFSLHPTSALGL